MTITSHRFLFICAAVCLAAGLWGLYWIPQRLLETYGLTGGWATIAQYIICIVVLIPFAVRRYLKGKQTGLALPLAGALMGGGIVCYANSILLTDVIRTMLLFYLTPFWASLIELIFLRKRPGWWRVISLPLALMGVATVLGDQQGFPLPANTGDWMALFGGAIYAAGAARVQLSKVTEVFPILFAFFLYGGLVAVCQALLLGASLGPYPEFGSWLSALPLLLLLSVLFFIPTNALISWAPSQISTGLFSILILTEIVFGTISAALWANEGFGWREIVGSVCILSAGVLEVVLSQKHRGL